MAESKQKFKNKNKLPLFVQPADEKLWIYYVERELKEIVERWRPRHWKDVTIAEIHHRGYHGESSALPKLKQTPDSSKENP